MKNVSQALQVSARVALEVDWEVLDGDALQKEVIELTPEEFGQRFTEFLKNGARPIIRDPKFVLTKPFNPAEFLGKGWTIWKGPADGDGLSGEEDVDSRSLALTEIELTKFIFKKVLVDGEVSITGEEKLRRLKEMSGLIRFGGNVFLGLWLDYQAKKENSILEWMYRNWNISLMDFFGLVLRHPDGRRSVICLDWLDVGEWHWRYAWLGRQWSAGRPSAGCAS